MKRNRGIDQMYSTGAVRRPWPNARKAFRVETRPKTARRIAAMIATYAMWPHGIIRRITFLWRGIFARGTKEKNSIEPRVHLFCRFTNPRTFSGRASQEWTGMNAEPWPCEARATAVAKSSDTYPSVKPPSSRTGRGRIRTLWAQQTTEPRDPASLTAQSSCLG